MEQSPTRLTPSKKPRRFNDEKIKRNLQAFHQKRLTPPPKRISDSSQGTVVGTTSPEAKGILPRFKPTESMIHVPEYTRGLKRLSALGAFLSGLCILVAFAEGEVTAAKGNEWSVLADVMRVVNICVGAAEMVLIVKFYNARLKVRIAQGEIDDRCSERQTITSPVLYHFKCILLKPFRTLAFTYVGVLLIGGALTRTYERSIPSSKLLDGSDGFWLAVETQATVGYGEMPPIGDLSRLACVLAAIAGWFTNAVVVTSFMRSAKLTLSEQQFAEGSLLSRRMAPFQQSSAVLIQRWWRLQCSRKNARPMRFLQVLTLHEQLERFRQQTKIIRNVKTNELDEAMSATGKKLTKRLHLELKYFRRLMIIKRQAESICTKLAVVTSKTLLYKRMILNITNLLAPNCKIRSRVQTEVRRSSTKIHMKRVSEGAFRRMLERRAEPRASIESQQLDLH